MEELRPPDRPRGRAPRRPSPSLRAQLPLDPTVPPRRCGWRDHVGLHPLTPLVQEPKAYRATVGVAGSRSALRRHQTPLTRLAPPPSPAARAPDTGVEPGNPRDHRSQQAAEIQGEAGPASGPFASTEWSPVTTTPGLRVSQVKPRPGSSPVIRQTASGNLGWRMRVRCPTASGPLSSRSIRVTVGVHSAHRSMSADHLPDPVGRAAISTAMAKSVTERAARRTPTAAPRPAGGSPSPGSWPVQRESYRAFRDRVLREVAAEGLSHRWRDRIDAAVCFPSGVPEEKPAVHPQRRDAIADPVQRTRDGRADQLPDPAEHAPRRRWLRGEILPDPAYDRRQGSWRA